MTTGKLYKKGDMLEVLERAWAALPSLLKESVDSWQSLDVDYEPPRVERLWRTFEQDYRLYLHRIHPCKPSQALFHPHPWPSAVHILSGGPYEMGVGFSGDQEDKDLPPPVACTLYMAEGSFYEMIDLDGWHYVRPITEPSLSLMITGRPWGRWSPSPAAGVELKPLSEDAKIALLTKIRTDLEGFHD